MNPPRTARVVFKPRGNHVELHVKSKGRPPDIFLLDKRVAELAALGTVRVLLKAPYVSIKLCSLAVRTRTDHHTVVDHIDGNPYDCRARNLQVTSQSHNCVKRLNKYGGVRPILRPSGSLRFRVIFRSLSRKVREFRSARNAMVYRDRIARGFEIRGMRYFFPRSRELAMPDWIFRNIAERVHALKAGTD